VAGSPVYPGCHDLDEDLIGFWGWAINSSENKDVGGAVIWGSELSGIRVSTDDWVSWVMAIPALSSARVREFSY